jgi:hypothetical protein
MISALWIEAIGFLAGIATVAAFSCRNMLWLRLVAISANGLFITYAVLLGLTPILILHCVLLPLNVLRLVALVGKQQGRVRLGAPCSERSS